MNTSIFRPYGLFFDDVSQYSLSQQVCRARDAGGRYYDIKIKNPWVIPQARLNPERFLIIIGESPNDALVKPDPGKTDLPEIGKATVAEIFGEVVCLGGSNPPQLVGTTNLLSNPEARKNLPILWELNPSKPQHEEDDPDAGKYSGAQTPGITSSQSGGMSIGQGTNMMSIGPNGCSIDADKTTTKTQEGDKAGGLLSTAPNLLQHYFIGLANAVALPMPHMVNVIKIAAIGKFVKTMVGKKGERKEDGTWKSGTGIFGLADEVAEIAKK